MHGVSWQSNESFDEVVAAEFATVFLLQPVSGSLNTTTSPRFQVEDFRGEFRGDHTVAWFDGVHHGSGGNHVESEQENTYQQHDNNRNSAPNQGVAQAKAVVAIVFVFACFIHDSFIRPVCTLTLIIAAKNRKRPS